MSTRSSIVGYEDEEFDLHIYHEMHDNAYHLEIYLKCSDGNAKGQNTYSFFNLVLPPDWVKAIVRFAEKNGNVLGVKCWVNGNNLRSVDK